MKFKTSTMGSAMMVVGVLCGMGNVMGAIVPVATWEGVTDSYYSSPNWREGHYPNQGDHIVIDCTTGTAYVDPVARGNISLGLGTNMKVLGANTKLTLTSNSAGTLFGDLTVGIGSSAHAEIYSNAQLDCHDLVLGSSLTSSTDEGRVSIYGGADVVVQNAVLIGRQTSGAADDGRGLLEVYGSGTTLDAYIINVGSAANGSTVGRFNLSDQADVTADYLVVGRRSQGTMIIDDGVMNVTGFTVVGGPGSKLSHFGRLDIEGAYARLVTPSLVVGDQVTGTVNLGNNAIVNTRSIGLGLNDATGHLNVGPGGLVMMDVGAGEERAIHIGKLGTTSGTGSLRLSNGRLIHSGEGMTEFRLGDQAVGYMRLMDNSLYSDLINNGGSTYIIGQSASGIDGQGYLSINDSTFNAPHATIYAARHGGMASFDIGANGVMYVKDFIAAEGSESSLSLRVMNENAALHTANFYTGDGASNISVESGGLIDVDGYTQMGGSARLTISGGLYGDGATFRAGNMSLEQNDGQFVGIDLGGHLEVEGFLNVFGSQTTTAFEMSVDGEDSLVSANSMSFAYRGNANLVISDHAQLNINESLHTAMMVYTDSGSSVSNITVQGKGQLNAGALFMAMESKHSSNLSIETGGDVYLGELRTNFSDDTTTNFNVTGFGSTLNVENNTIMGAHGSDSGFSKASMIISDYGAFNTSSVSLGEAEYSRGVIKVMDYGRANLGNCRIGVNGEGELHVDQYSEATAGSMSIGVNSSGDGHVIVKGIAAELNVNGIMHVGNEGEGRLDIISGGSVNVDYDVRVGECGRLNLWGGHLRLRELHIDDSAALHWDAGMVEFAQQDGVDTLIYHDSAIDKLLGWDHALTAGQKLVIHNHVSLGTSMAIDGGELQVGSMVSQGGPALLSLQSGHIAFESVGSVDEYSVLGSRLELNKHVEVSAAEMFYNMGFITGSGAITDRMVIETYNDDYGTGQDGTDSIFYNIENAIVQVNKNERLFIDMDIISNRGLIEVLDGQLIATARLDNYGTLTGAGSYYYFEKGIVNRGEMNFADTEHVIHGNVEVLADGQLSVMRGGKLTLQDDWVLQGVGHVSDDASVVVFGEMSGDGVVTGGGRVYVEGAIGPGNSPGDLEIEGDLVLGESSRTVMELAGYEAGINYDQMIVTNEIYLAGELEVVLLEMFKPAAGDAFVLFDAGEIVGMYETMMLPSVGGGLSWDTSRLYEDGVIRVIPEPTSLVLLGLGGLCVMWRRCA